MNNSDYWVWPENFKLAGVEFCGWEHGDLEMSEDNILGWHHPGVDVCCFLMDEDGDWCVTPGPENEKIRVFVADNI